MKSIITRTTEGMFQILTAFSVKKRFIKFQSFLLLSEHELEYKNKDYFHFDQNKFISNKDFLILIFV